MADIEHLSDGDRILLQNVVHAKSQAEATHRFVAHHVAAIYQLTEGCAVDLSTGTITRPTPEVPNCD